MVVLSLSVVGHAAENVWQLLRQLNSFNRILSRVRRFSFPPEYRIRKRHDFLAARNRGRRLRTPHFYIHMLAGSGSVTRLGITASRRVGNAVVRNRIKRLVREFYRHHRDLLPLGVDISIVARRDSGQLSLADVTEEMKVLLG